MATKKPTGREVYNVVPNPKGGWDVKREGGARASSRHETKQPAIKDARERAQKAELGQVRVHGHDGRIQTEWTYGKDPRRSRG